MKAKIINLLGSPGVGKSTIAARVYSELKSKGAHAELVTEFIKDRIWEGNKAALDNQLYIFASQYYRLTRVATQVDFIVCDGPLITEPLYNNYPEPMRSHLNTLVEDVVNQFDNMNYLIKRSVDYEIRGRLHSQEESDQKFTELQTFLIDKKVSYKMIPGGDLGWQVIMNDLKEWL